MALQENKQHLLQSYYQSSYDMGGQLICTTTSLELLQSARGVATERGNIGSMEKAEGCKIDPMWSKGSYSGQDYYVFALKFTNI